MVVLPVLLNMKPDLTALTLRGDVLIIYLYLIKVLLRHCTISREVCVVQGKKSRFLKWGVVVFIVLIAAVVIAQMAFEASMQSQTTIVAGIQELQGIQGADETTVVAQKQKMRKKGPSGVNAAKTLERIDQDKKKEFKVINGAMETQSSMYGAYKDEKDAEAAKLMEKLKAQIPEAQSSLKRLRRLTDEQVQTINGSTKDAQAVKVAESTYSSWKAAVDSLKVDPLTEQDIKSRQAALSQNSAEAIKGAQEQAKGIDAATLPPEDKDRLRSVVGSGQNIMSAMQNIMAEMQKAMQGMMNSLTGGGKSSNPLSRIQNMTSGKKDGGINKESFDRLQKVMEGVAGQIQGFFGNFGPYLQTVGGIVGMPVSIPSLPAFGNMGAMKGMPSGGAPSAPSKTQLPPAAQPQSPSETPKQPAAVNAGLDGVPAIEAFPVDDATKNAILINHKGGYANMSKRKYPLAFNQFVKAVELYDGNYVDAYWAAVAAQKIGKKPIAREWVDKALAANPQYQPALDLRKSLK